MNPVRTKDREQFGLALRCIFGLNIFAANGVKVPADSDPRVVFLRTLTAHNACSAHTGNLLDVADDPQELFGEPTSENAYLFTRIGVYKGTFYDVQTWNTFPACFFPRVKDSFWQVQTLDGASGVEAMLDWDALALYVGANGKSSAQMKLPLEQPFPGHEGWLQQMASLCRVVILSGDGGWDFYAYAQDASNFSLLTPAITIAIEALESNDWYRRHSASLVWDGEYEGGLLLPESLNRP